jgi:hypothetical protein
MCLWMQKSRPATNKIRGDSGNGRLIEHARTHRKTKHMISHQRIRTTLKTSWRFSTAPTHLNEKTEERDIMFSAICCSFALFLSFFLPLAVKRAQEAAPPLHQRKIPPHSGEATQAVEKRRRKQPKGKKKTSTTSIRKDTKSALQLHMLVGMQRAKNAFAVRLLTGGATLQRPCATQSAASPPSVIRAGDGRRKRCWAHSQGHQCVHCP